jgi:uncharacterized protein (DUF488 family)
MSEMPQILTIGHSTHPIERFLGLLGAAGVEIVADVRRFPGSRRNPQFGAAALRASLAGVSIGNQSFGEELGGRRRASAASRGETDAGSRPPSHNSGWRNASFRAYADYMDDPSFRRGLERLEAIAGQHRTAVMCAEAHLSRCHRRLIADALLARGWQVVHLLADGRRACHALSAHAVIDDGRVSYPGPARLDV